MHNQPYPPYRKDLISKARELRKNSTPGEIELWKTLKNKQLLGLEFRRQRPINHFIVDFFCKELMLAIEIDGNSHDYKIGYDLYRQNKLEELGIHFLRFSEQDAAIYTESILIIIEEWALSFWGTLPSIPSKEGKLIFEYPLPKKYFNLPRLGYT